MASFDKVLKNMLERAKAGVKAGNEALAAGKTQEQATAAAQAATGLRPKAQSIAELTERQQSDKGKPSPFEEKGGVGDYAAPSAEEEDQSAFSGKEENADDKDKAKKAKYASTRYDTLRDLGGLIPIVGPVVSGAGSFMNWMDTGPMEDTGAVTRPQEVVGNQEYLASPESIAMPNADQIETSFPSEQAKNQYLSNTAAPLDSFIAESMMPGVGGLIGKGVMLPAKVLAKVGSHTPLVGKATKAIGEKAGKALMDSPGLGKALTNIGAEKSGKTINEAVDAGDALFADALSEKANTLSKEAAEKYMDDLPEGAQKIFKNIQNTGPEALTEDAVKEYAETLPSNLRDYLDSFAQPITRGGKYSGMMSAADEIPKASKEAVKQGLEETLGRMFRPVARGVADFNSPISPKADETSTNPYQPPAYNRGVSQIEELVDWATTDPEGIEFARTNPWVFDYMLDPDNLGAFNADDYMKSGAGYGQLFGTNDPELYAYLFGLNGASRGIEGWRNRAKAIGIDLDAEDALDQVMDAIFGNNAIDISNINDPRMQYGNYGPDAIANAQIARYLSDTYGFSPTWAQAAGMDANDFAQYMMVANMMQNGTADMSLDDLNAIWSASGDPSSFGYIGNEGVQDERESRKNTNKHGYNLANVGQSAVNSQGAIINDYLQPWLEGGAPSYDASLVDAVLQSWNASHPNNQIGLKY